MDGTPPKVRSFFPFSYWPKTGKWAAKETLPVDKLGHANWDLTRSSHPGPDQKHVLVRRWLVPRDAAISLSGTLIHPGMQGDGVRARLFTQRGRVGGPWVAHKNRADTLVPRLEVKRGDIVDLVVDCRTNDAGDTFEWSPSIQVLECK
jgi:hypothetical protein